MNNPAIPRAPLWKRLWFYLMWYVYAQPLREEMMQVAIERRRLRSEIKKILEEKTDGNNN